MATTIEHTLKCNLPHLGETMCRVEYKYYSRERMAGLQGLYYGECGDISDIIPLSEIERIEHELLMLHVTDERTDSEEHLDDLRQAS
jgi:hypothetical protein